MEADREESTSVFAASRPHPDHPWRCYDYMRNGDRTMITLRRDVPRELKYSLHEVITIDMKNCMSYGVSKKAAEEFVAEKHADPLEDDEY